MTSCTHGHPDDSPIYCPDCARMVKEAARRIKENGGVSPRRLRKRAERLARKGRAG